MQTQIDKINNRLDLFEFEVRSRLSTGEVIHSEDETTKVDVPIHGADDETCGPTLAGVDSPDSRSKHFCEFVAEMTSRSSLHGLPVLTTTGKRWIKLFWILLMLAGFGMAVWQLTEIFAEYFRAPVVSKVETLNGGVDLPQVTVCNTKIPYLESAVLRDSRFRGYVRERRGSGNYSMIDWISQLPIDDRIKLSHNITNFITWRDDLERASELTYTLVPSMYGGNCYSFLQNSHPKNVPDIKLFINLNSKESILGWKGEGIAFLQEKDQLTFPDYYREPFINIEAGYKVVVRIKMETIVRLNGRYGQCSDIEETFNEEAGVRYSQDACKSMCPVLYTLGKCGCVLKDISSLPTHYNISKLIENAAYCTKTNSDCYRNAQTRCDCKVRCVMKRYVVTNIQKIKIEPSFCDHWQECMEKDNETDRQ